MKSKTNKGWTILDSRHGVTLSKIIGKIILTVERNKYMGNQKIRISDKYLIEIYNLLDKKAQRVRK